MRRLDLLLASALACAPEPATPAHAPVVAVESQARADPAAPPPVIAAPAGAAPVVEPEDADLGVPPCDDYLRLYRSCEPELRAEIMAGERRFARAEAAHLRHLHEHDRDPGLASACESMLVELERRCLRAP